MKKETYWSKFADDFEERNNYVVGKESMAEILRIVSAQKVLGKTLELGCGNGTYSKILMHEATHLTATDFSDEMVAATQKRMENIENITIEKADCFHLAYPDSVFDTVFMANLLHIIPEPEKAGTESRRVLKKGGRLVVISFTTEGMIFSNKLGMIYRYLKTYGKPPSTAQKLTVKKAWDIIEGSGFKIEEATLIGNKVKAIFIRALVD